MFHRILKPSINSSFFIFGQRGSGKSTFLKQQIFNHKNFHYIDLLEDKNESRYKKSPDLLTSDVKVLPNQTWIIIDEIQKNPKLLDLVHKLIVEDNYKFILTGSSARKLKRSGANLLAGRSFWYQMFPLTQTEINTDGKFDLEKILSWGSLPQIFSFTDDQDKSDFLKSYVKTYLKEEILEEQIVRNIDGFRNFLDIAALMNGKNINFSKIGRDCNIDTKTVQEYFQILDDTLVGFWLPAFHESVRKEQKLQPKFYLFDVGIIRAISNQLDIKPTPGTSFYGQYFESFLISEIYKYNSYCRTYYKMSHYQTTANHEIDLILTKGFEKTLIEIKSYTQIDPLEVKKFSKISSVFKTDQKYFISQDPTASLIDGVQCLHYLDFIQKIFLDKV